MTCPICNDTFVVIVAGPDENGNYDADDCPCQYDDSEGNLVTNPTAYDDGQP